MPHAMSYASATCCSVVRFNETPLPWFPSSGFTTPGPLKLRNASIASSRLFTTSPRGTGMAAASRKRLVSLYRPRYPRR
jgi:hypothetical protein